jgi:hypothetical protein
LTWQYTDGGLLISHISSLMIALRTHTQISLAEGRGLLLETGTRLRGLSPAASTPEEDGLLCDKTDDATRANELGRFASGERLGASKTNRSRSLMNAMLQRGWWLVQGCACEDAAFAVPCCAVFTVRGKTRRQHIVAAEGVGQPVLCCAVLCFRSVP